MLEPDEVDIMARNVAPVASGRWSTNGTRTRRRLTFLSRWRDGASDVLVAQAT